MKPIVKVFATLSLATAIGERIEIDEPDKYFKIAGQALKKAGFDAVANYSYPMLTSKTVNDIGDSVRLLLSTSIKPAFVLSMLIAGLTDIRAKCNPDKHPLLDPVIECIEDCFNIHRLLYPGVIVDHDAAFKQYEKWTA